MRIILLLGLLVSSKGLFFGGLGQKNARESLKKDLLQLSTETKRGLSASPEQKDKMYDIFTRLERMNPTKKTLKSPLVNAVWSLEYTTSESILGKGGLPRIGPQLQTIDTTRLSAENSEVVNFLGLKIPSKIEATLSPASDYLTDVKFDRFVVGPVKFDAPDLRGSLDITYLDEDMRLTRGDLGNIFVLTRYDDV